MLRSEKIQKKIRQDILEGKFRKRERLPDSKSLGDLYGVSQPTLRNIMRALVKEGVLSKAGGGYSETKAAVVQSKRSVLRLVMGGSADGVTLETSREKEFYKAAVDQANEYNLDLQVISLDDWDGNMSWFDSKGKALRRFPGIPSNAVLMGTMLSTWHLGFPEKAVSKMIKSGKEQPISVWTETGKAQDWLPSPGFCRIHNLRFFDVAYGEQPGIIVADALKSEGVEKVGYVSPFHKAQWSIDRLKGLEKVLGNVVHDFCSDRYISSWDYRHEVNKDNTLQSLRGETALRVHALRVRPEQKLMQESILWDLWRDDRIIDDLEPLFQRAWKSGVSVWVCSNDLVALCAKFWLNSNGIAQEQQPRLIGFDNEPETYRAGIDSFEFDMASLANSMIDYILRPSNVLFASSTQIKIGGRFCKKF